MKGDAAIGKAIREFIEQDTGKWESVNLRIELYKGDASFDWQREVDGKVLVFTYEHKEGEQIDRVHTSVHGETLADALRAAGLMEEEGK